MKNYRCNYRRIIKKIAFFLFGPYELNRIYTLDITNYSTHSPSSMDLRKITDEDVLLRSDDPAVRQRAWYSGEEAFGFGLWEDGTLAAFCWFWTSIRFYKLNIWSIGDREAIIVDLFTLERFRGQGYAPALLRFAASEMKQLNFKRLYAFVWHSNFPSISAFNKAHWKYISFVVELFPLRTKKSLRFVLKKLV